LKSPGSQGIEASFKPIDTGAGFLLDLQGHKVVSLRLPGKVAKEISSEDVVESGGIFMRLKAKLGLIPETEQWLTVTSVDNPLLPQLDNFKALVAQQLTTATGTPITHSNLAVCASIPLNGTDQSQPPDNGRMPIEPPS
jgi:hypothetical protein